MNKYGLLGYKLAHSYSPLIHQFIFHENNIKAKYCLLEIEEEEIPSYLDLLRKGFYQGYNVTIPYKEKVIPFLDELTEAAAEIGAVNTIYVKAGRLIGDNTDYLGFMDEMKQLHINPINQNAYVLGSGGASKAICYALTKMGYKPIVVSRDSQKGISYDELIKKNSYGLIVNTTPLGMFPNIDASPLEKSTVLKANIVVDLIFNPKETKLLSYAENGYNGSWMLIYQALHSEVLWQQKDLSCDTKKLIKLLEGGNINE